MSPVYHRAHIETDNHSHQQAACLWTVGGSRRTQRGPRGDPEGTQREPRENPEGTQREPRGNPERTQREPRGNPRCHGENSTQKDLLGSDLGPSCFQVTVLATAPPCSPWTKMLLNMLGNTHIRFLGGVRCENENYTRTYPVNMYLKPFAA